MLPNSSRRVGQILSPRCKIMELGENVQHDAILYQFLADNERLRKKLECWPEPMAGSLLSGFRWACSILRIKKGFFNHL